MWYIIVTAIKAALFVLIQYKCSSWKLLYIFVFCAGMAIIEKFFFIIICVNICVWMNAWYVTKYQTPVFEHLFFIRPIFVSYPKMNY